MFRNDLNKATGLRKRRKKKKIFVMKFTGTNVPGGSAFAATAGQGTRGSEALWGGQNPPLDLPTIDCGPDPGPNLNLGAVLYLEGKRSGPDPAPPLSAV